jgi:hypothetical protein
LGETQPLGAAGNSWAVDRLHIDAVPLTLVASLVGIARSQLLDSVEVMTQASADREIEFNFSESRASAPPPHEKSTRLDRGRVKTLIGTHHRAISNR